MAMLLLLSISAAALLAVELRVSRATVSHAKARLNAMAAARIALGRLQSLAGNDRRITAPATILDRDAKTWGTIEGVKQPRLVGVWRGRSVGSEYTDTHKKAFLDWLTSGDIKTGLDYPKSPVTNAIRLLSAASSPDTGLAALSETDSAEVSAAPETILDSRGADSGSLAWWIADENMKANLSLRLPTKTPTAAESLAMAQNAVRLGLKVTDDGVFKDFPETLPFRTPSISRESLAFDTEDSNAGPGFWLKDVCNYFHDITPYSESLLTDVVNGGLKYDLSLMFALDKLPEGYRENNGKSKVINITQHVEDFPPSLSGLGFTVAPVGLESQVAGAGEYAKAKGKWMTDSTPPGMPTLSTLSDLNKLEWTGWPDAWSYARLYKATTLPPDATAAAPFDPQKGLLINNIINAMGGTTDNNGGVRDPVPQSYLDPEALNSLDRQNLSPWREPVITQFQIAIGFRAKETATGSKMYNLSAIFRPYFQIWNPYNIPLRLDDGTIGNLIRARLIELPGQITITTTGPGGATYKWASWWLMATSGNQIFNTVMEFKNEPPLAPGEVRVFSPKDNFIVGRGVNDNTIGCRPGLRPFGGYETPLRADSTGKAVAPFAEGLTVNVNASVSNPSIAGVQMEIDWSRAGIGNISQDNQTITGARGVRVDTTTSPDVIAKIDTRSKDAGSPAELDVALHPSGWYFTRYTMRLRTETQAARKFPFFAYGDPIRQVFRPKPSASCDTDPEARMSPYEVVHSKISDPDDFSDDNPPFQTNPAGKTNATGELVNGYAFTGYTAANGLGSMIYSHIPLAPLGSLGELRDARLGGGVSYCRFFGVRNGADRVTLPAGRPVVQDAFGNSFAHPMIAQGTLAGTTALGAKESYYDFSWITNASLWDAYCLTGFAAEDSPIAEFKGKGRALDRVADDFLTPGATLANNRRVLFHDYGVGGAAIKTLLVNGTKPTDDAFAKATAVMAVNGGFNINSTSVRAWRAMLAGLDKAKLAQIATGLTTVTLPSPTTTPCDSPGAALRNPLQNGPLADENTGAYDTTFNTRRALAGRKLSDAQLIELAQKIVEEVKKRGPFLSLGEFMNRRLESGPLGEKGAVQAAIDATSINLFAKSSAVAQVTTGDTPGMPSPAAVTGSQARGMPGVICQADIVSPLAMALTARSDTFTIRAAGTSDDGATAYVEMVVRRDARYLDTTDAPFVLPDKITMPANKAFGRRFTPVLVRWINPENI
jgi:hypothetical protein